MFEMNRTLRVVLLLLVLSYLPACSVWVEKVVLEKPTYFASCSNGLVAEKDYFILNGQIAINEITNGRYGKFSIHYKTRRRGIGFLRDTVTMLRWTNCTDAAIIKSNTCTCKFFELEYVRVKCNITARPAYSEGSINLLFVTEGGVDAYRSSWVPLPYVYESSGCTFASVNRAARSHPDSFSALLGTALLSTAVVCLVSSTISQI